MLTPEYLNLIEFNNVVELYNKLNEEITVDIITRVAQMQDITETTRKQLEILKQTNGTDIFNKALEKTSMLTAETKKALKLLFEDMVKEDMEGYEELYEYRDKPFKLSESQYKILNQGLKETNRTLKNFTNTIAFQSQQAYVEAVDSAYMKVASGAFDYATAIHTACQELANKGITLKDKLGRNVQLEVAVRRNVMTGIQQTANHINRDIEEYLGCDGYEVTAHLGARPSHAEAQGKQYAIKHNTKISKDYPLWSEVEDLWSEYNCRHTYFGIILGISEPKYTDEELKEFKEATVTLNGKKISYYEATQKQRQLENAIRKQKRTVQTLEKSNLDNKLEKGQLAQLQKKYQNFCKETGLEKDYSRIRIAKNKVTNSNNGGKIEKISEVLRSLKKSKIEYNPVQKLRKTLTEDEIIEKISGGDETKGSCVSVALTYIGNKNGLDVLDFRGGESQSYFGTNGTIYRISQLSNIKSIIEESSNDTMAAMKLLKEVEEGKEYFLGTGQHGAIVRKNNGKLQYLELQDKEDNGFKQFTTQTLKKRFGCKQSHSKYGFTLKFKNILIEVESFKDNKEFEEILGYINTQKSKQMKGFGGYAK